MIACCTASRFPATNRFIMPRFRATATTARPICFTPLNTNRGDMDTNKASNPQPLSPTLTGAEEDGLPPRTVKALLAEGHLAIQAELSRLIEPLVTIGDPDLNDRLFRLLAMIWV